MSYYVLRDNRVRQRAQHAILEAPEGHVVTIKPATRTLEQNALIHAALAEVGDAIGWKFNGQAVDLDDLKSIFMAAYRKACNEQARFVMGIDGQPVILNWRTRDLSKKECAEFLDLVFAWLSERN